MKKIYISYLFSIALVFALISCSLDEDPISEYQ